MTTSILPFPPFHVRVAPAREGGWLVLCRSHGWLHGNRDAALADAKLIAAAYGTGVLSRPEASIQRPSSGSNVHDHPHRNRSA
jgi:hypothetical protein